MVAEIDPIFCPSSMVSKAFDCVVFFKSRMLHGRISSHATMFLQNVTIPMSRFSLNEPDLGGMESPKKCP